MSWIMACVMMLSLAPETNSPGIPTLDELRAGLSDSEAALENMTLKCKQHIKQQAVYNGVPVELDTVFSISVDSLGRVLYESVGDYSSTHGKKPGFTMRGSFDGQTLKEFDGFNSNWSGGVLSDKRDENSWKVDPWEYATHYCGRSISAAIEKYGAHVLGRHVWDKRQVVVLELNTSINNFGGEFKCRFYIDVHRGFAPVRKAGLFRDKSQNDWYEYTCVEGRDYREIQPGIWLPTRVLQEDHRLTDDHGLMARREINFVKVEVNTAFPEDHFKLNFPPGIDVNDHINGGMFRTARITDQDLADAAHEAKHVPIQDPKLHARRSQFFIRWLTVACVGLASVAVLSWLWRRMRGQRHRD